MIETKFRGKRIDNNPYHNNGEWVYGGILTTVLGEKCDRIDIVSFDSDYLSFRNIQVDEKTCGQYTGSKDKKGREIYDGDIIKCDIPLRNVFNPEYIGYVSIDLKLSGGITLRNKHELVSDKNLVQLLDKIEVIGNIYDNKDLL